MAQGTVEAKLKLRFVKSPVTSRIRRRSEHLTIQFPSPSSGHTSIVPNTSVRTRAREIAAAITSGGR